MATAQDTSRGPSICLCMIVRDEESVIERCLASVRGLIDHWVICDTGSVDRTRELVTAALAGVPGTLYEREWVDFGTNRTQALELARGTADYLLILDADTTLEVEDGALDRLTADAYMLRQTQDQVSYSTKRLVRADLGWRYIGAVHEYIESPQERTCEELTGVQIRTWSVGALRSGRFERDLELLERSVAADPTNTRDAFYLAQTHRDLGNREAAANAYRHRALMGGWDEEVYCSWHQLGVLELQLGNWPGAVEAFLLAREARPRRLEADYDLVVGLLERHQFRTAYTFSQVARGGRIPLPNDVLFVQPWVYQWGLAFQFVVAAYWVEDYDGAIAVARRLLKDPAVPEAEHAQTSRNLEFALSKRGSRVAGTRTFDRPRSRGSR